ncbi:dipeptide-binding protein [Treponema primitia ZAS-2]|uniref:Dipeptide-binding protein n=1 Tax=Treponema primitia (strain ATCC BAA-887 / DSM 12427 / ZAS-2) TaxID=545694 RepID=F5YJY3_TREPZ|nr:ABC transporter substrate-binding protein [Treponema primitia]AEF84565.1 dipeptide-binding protein [Treponema primitia ZAS-2]
MKKQNICFAIGLICLVMALAGCGKSGSKAQAGGYKDTIIFGQGADVTSLDPHIGKETPAVTVTNHIFDTLVEVDGVTNELKPQIAERWEQLSPTSYRFFIRKGIKFHDGTELTAADVKFSLDRAIATPAVAYIVDFISNVTVEDPYTVVVNTHAPYGPTLRNLSVPFAAIIPKAAVEANPTGFIQHPIGSGPYKFVSWKQSDSVQMEAFADYYAGAPKTKNLIMKVIPEPSQRTIALETGELDLAYDLTPNDLKIITGNDKLTVFKAPSLSCTYISMNMRKAPFNNKLVRQAISHAIDRQLIVDTVLSGAGQAADAIIAPAVYGYFETGVDKFDPELSKQLLAQAGYPNGFSCSLWVNNSVQRVEICQAIIEMLRNVGITARLEVMELGAFIQRSTAGEHDMGAFGWVTSTKDADYTYYSLEHSSQQGAAGNRTFTADPEVDRLVDLGRTSVDPAIREKAYKDLAIYLADLENNVNIAYTEINVGGNNNVENFFIDPIGYHKLENVQVKK